jgi:hypothetical protein
MTEPAERSLADDESALAAYGIALADAVEQVAAPWLRRLVEQHLAGASATHGDRLDVAASAMVHDLRALLNQDIADQRIGPLEILRGAIPEPTAILAEANVAPVERDDFAQRNFPNDVYNLTPASFADVDPSLHEPGIVWGAAKAHVHLRRRREAPATQSAIEVEPTRQIVALSVDLMDRSKISGALPDAKLVRSFAKLVELDSTADVFLVDLGRIDDPAVLAELSTPVIAFGSHVDDAVLAAATEAGAEAMPRSVFFRRLETGEI